jgi:peptide/nickel transport system permease protein
MIKYVIQKTSYALLTLWGVITVIFFLFNVLPGDPARMMLDQNENSEQLLLIKKKYGFDQPLTLQYLYYLNDLSPISLHSDNPKNYTYFDQEKYSGFKLINLSTSIVIKKPYLRESFQKSGKKVSEVIAITFPNTIVLAVSAIIIAIIFGLLFGIISAIYKDTLVDRWIAIISSIGMSIPSFFSAILFAWLFGYVWHSITNLNMIGSLYEIDNMGNGKKIAFKNIILPAIVLGIRPIGIVTQLMRNSLLETFSQDYIKTAVSKGLSQKQVIFNHAIKNSLNPVVTALSGWFASLLAGSVFVEYIFGWNGLGKEIVDALYTMDLPIIMGAVLVIAFSFIIINILVDIIYAYLDPKISNY